MESVAFRFVDAASASVLQSGGLGEVFFGIRYVGFVTEMSNLSQQKPGSAGSAFCKFLSGSQTSDHTLW